MLGYFYYILNFNFALYSYPDNTLLRSIEDGKVYLIKDDVKYYVTGPAVLADRDLSWSAVQNVAPAILNNLASGEAINYLTGDMIKTSDSPTVYLILRGKIRPIANAEIFLGSGYSWTDVKNVSVGALGLYALGPTLKNAVQKNKMIDGDNDGLIDDEELEIYKTNPKN